MRMALGSGIFREDEQESRHKENKENEKRRKLSDARI
jgi:hypothetical protein